MMISIIVPVYNGEKTLNELYSRIIAELDGSYYFEVIFVYDCGKDKSWEIIREMARSESDHIRAYCFDKNYGQHYATSFGLQKASGDYIFTLDEDSQHDPKFIPVMIKKMEDENLDLIYGQFSKLKQPFFRVIMSFFLRRVLCVMIPNLPHDYSAYRLIRKDLANKIIEKENFSLFIDAELDMLSRNHSNLLVEHFKRAKGTSSYTIIKLLKQSFDVLFKYSKLFRLFLNSFIIVILFWLTYSFYLLLLNPIQYLIVFVFLFISFLTIIWIRRNSLQRIHGKQTPKVVEQINLGK